ncbi:MAG: hydrogenase formation protein HypD [Phycisphaerae bacterium]|nr:hydrogenase formation protein HypD [Phycisphaerae bacterium]
MEKVVKQYCEKIHKSVTELLAVRPEGRGTARLDVAVMEICGTHTMAIASSGLRNLLPASLRLVSGPGCPVCVTDQSYIDRAVHLSQLAGGPVIATYGDMVRVPGRSGSLAEARAAGAAIEVVASATRAVELAKQNPGREIVFLAVGFETTAPGTALAVLKAREEKVKNFSVFTAHKLILPVMRALLSADDVRVDGFLCPGHVSVIIGWGAYEEIARRYRRPCVVAGFDPAQIVAGIAEIVRQLAEDGPAACSVYPSVSKEGNPAALKLLEDVFVLADVPWRALGVVPQSGLELREEFAAFDTAGRFDLPEVPSYELPGCRCGDVLSGRCLPADCDLFADRCTPRRPVGPCMVSSEGACAAAYKYERR